jgi:hypothetical protein
LSTVALAELYAIEQLYFLTEQRLATHLSKVGFIINQVSRPMEHRGPRIVSTANVPVLVRGLNRHLKALYDVIRPQVAAASV